MIVLDASAIVELLLETDSGGVIASRIADPEVGLHVPHLVDVEVTQALRRFRRDGEIEEAEAQAALDNLLALDIERHSHEPLLSRAWQLRNNLSAYDAMYVALAEALDALLLTTDSKLARAAGTMARIELIETTSER